MIFLQKTNKVKKITFLVLKKIITHLKHFPHTYKGYSKQKGM
jgi:hypothetical protein